MLLNLMPSSFKGCIFQTLWKPDYFTKSLFIEFDIPNFSYTRKFFFGDYTSITSATRWVGWLNTDVFWQVRWVWVAKCWREQKIRKKRLFACTEKLTFLCGTFFYEHFIPNLALVIREKNICRWVGLRKCWRHV